MKFETKVLVFVLTVLPSDIWAQSLDRMTPETPPLLWRDGYVNWRGKLVKPRWQMMSADDGTKFAIDLSKKSAHYAAAYIVDGEAFNKSNLFELQFDCAAKVFEVITSMDLKRAQIVETKARQLVCDDAQEIR
ncbi:hypothetical protein IVB46_02580 [Bradyrhizobium sp. 61]|uniref:Uncharacterized protein n=1 Tax=Bradyrhizobium barranii subsp. barranii TaxID=2823807 RepID=A0A7Z0QDE1_9BRAD|nr:MULTISPECIES: hypothetical protein [Bradyrhizobium]MCK1274127.1 hypothetical protein [Bradyrhizobium sp. 61]MCK1447449.1 hypothetical protein [Bradyrhizobium sp. 48]MCK1462785.1 hypothetical protein [Bradyrhizobium sp. 2]UGX91577.1 hypothetical protein G6321_00038370 [Bradyrhizobium barranii subsp. barranii]